MSRPSLRPPLDAQRIAVLEQVEFEGTISGAADALNFTGSAVSQQLRQLESELGVELVDRGPRAATLTTAGQVLLAHGVELRAQLVTAERELREIAALARGRLRVGSFRSAGETLCAEAISYFKAHWPDIEMTLREGEPEELMPLARRGELDLVLAFEYDEVPSRFDSQLEFVRLCEDEIVVVLPLSHRLAALDEIPLEALRDEAWIASTERCSVSAFTERACRKAGFEPVVAMTTDDYRIAQALVAHGGGVTFLPRLATRVLDPRCTARPLAGSGFSRRLFAAHRIGGMASPALARMLEVLSDAAADVDR